MQQPFLATAFWTKIFHENILELFTLLLIVTDAGHWAWFGEGEVCALNCPSPSNPN